MKGKQKLEYQVGDQVAVKAPPSPSSVVSTGVPRKLHPHFRLGHVEKVLEEDKYEVGLVGGGKLTRQVKNIKDASKLTLKTLEKPVKDSPEMRFLDTLDEKCNYFVLKPEEKTCDLFHVETVSPAGVEGWYYGTTGKNIRDACFLPLYGHESTGLFVLKERDQVLEEGYTLKREYWNLDEFLAALVPMGQVSLTASGRLGTKSLKSFKRVKPRVKHHYF